MLDNLIVNPNSEFFVSIVKNGIHSSLILGVMVDNQAITLAKVGKSNLIDQGFDTSCAGQFSLFKKELVTHTEAALMDEGVNSNLGMNYQAFSITYQQYLDFLEMFKTIHLEQLNHYQKRSFDVNKDYGDLSFPEKGVYKLRKGIKCFIPMLQESGQITFQYQDIKTFNGTAQNKQKPQEMINGAKQLSASNTCRTTARSILNYVLGYCSNISEHFLINLDYHMKKEGDFFYILPPPPNFYQVDTTRKQILQELYAKLEELPKKYAQLELTREKFNKLKQLYCDISARPEISFVELLTKIEAHKSQHQNLFSQHRGQSIISLIAQKLGIKTATEESYEAMVKTVVKELDRLDKAKTQKPQGIKMADSIRPLDSEEVFIRSLQRINRAF